MELFDCNMCDPILSSVHLTLLFVKGRNEEMSLQEGRIRQKGNLYYSLLPVLIYNNQILSSTISQLIHSCMIPLTRQLNVGYKRVAHVGPLVANNILVLLPIKIRVKQRGMILSYHILQLGGIGVPVKGRVGRL